MQPMDGVVLEVEGWDSEQCGGLGQKAALCLLPVQLLGVTPPSLHLSFLFSIHDSCQTHVQV